MARVRYSRSVCNDYDLSRPELLLVDKDATPIVRIIMSSSKELSCWLAGNGSGARCAIIFLFLPSYERVSIGDSPILQQLSLCYNCSCSKEEPTSAAWRHSDTFFQHQTPDARIRWLNK